jgi:hypothetical protein
MIFRLLVSLLLMFSIFSCEDVDRTQSSGRKIIYDTSKVLVYDTVKIIDSDKIIKNTDHSKHSVTNVYEVISTIENMSKNFDSNLDIEEINNPVISIYKLNSDEDSEDEYVVVKSFAMPSSEFSFMKDMYHIDYKMGKYIVTDSIIENKFYDKTSMYTDEIIDDIVNDRGMELILKEKTVYSGGSNFYEFVMYSFSSGKILKIPQGKTLRHTTYNYNDKSAYVLNEIWEVGESRFDFHHYLVEKIKFGDKGINKIGEWKTSNKHHNEELNMTSIISDAVYNGSSGAPSSKILKFELKSIDELYNDHVGNEWKYSIIINGKSVKDKTYELEVNSGENIEIIFGLTETNEKFDDKEYIIQSFKESEITSETKIYSVDLIIREENGKYAGNSAKFRFTYSVNFVSLYLD